MFYILSMAGDIPSDRTAVPLSSRQELHDEHSVQDQCHEHGRPRRPRGIRRQQAGSETGRAA
ncbi:conserved hypothetical protein [Burkholderia cenocepacia]|nr:conserved hypothetical protein [Burkholderia cenocepacia]